MPVVTALALAGCPGEDVVHCGDLLCPTGSRCYDNQCATAEQIEQCQGQDDGAACTLEGVGDGACRGGLCVGAGCGNGVIEAAIGERCDDGNREGHDGCNALCNSNEQCGNGIVDELEGEGCDLGIENSDAPGAACRTTCHPASCNDGVLDPTEDCDAGQMRAGSCATFGFYAGTLACTSCRFDVRNCDEWCGDGAVQSDQGEICDGNQPAETCVQLGYDFGTMGCADNCGLDFGGCRRIGWQPLPGYLVTADFGSIWSPVRGDLWAVDNASELIHFDGSWSKPYAASFGNALFAVYAASPTDVFAVGQVSGKPVVVRSPSWSETTLTFGFDFRAVWGSSGNNVFAVGGAGTIGHFDGTTWQDESFATATALVAVSGDGANVFAAGDGIVLARDPGGTWQSLNAPSVGFSSLWAVGSQVYVIGGGSVYTYDTAASSPSWAPLATPGSVTAGWGDGANTFLIAAGAQLWHSDGTLWTHMDVPGVANLDLMTGRDATDVYAAGATTALHFDGLAWSVAEPIAGVTSLFGTSVTDMYATHGMTVSHFDGAQWDSGLPPTETAAHERYDVWSNGRCGDSDGCLVVAVGKGDKFASDPPPLSASVYDGSWTETPIPTNYWLTSVWGLASGDVLATVNAGHVVAYNGIDWTVDSGFDALATGTGTATAIWGRGSEVFVGTGLGYVFQYNTAWTKTNLTMQLGFTFSPYFLDVWGTNTSVFVVGLSGVIVRYASGAWSAMTTNTTGNLRAVWGTSDADVYAGGDTTLLHYDGAVWSPVRIPPSLTAIEGVWGDSHHMFVGGSEIRQLLRTGP